jgi:hypothetical protein
MSDFSSSGMESMGFPALTHEALTGQGDPRVLGWLREAVQEGDRISKSDPSYDKMSAGMAYVAGDQRPQSAPAQGKPSYIPSTTINESRRVVQSHASALTDLKPLFAYKSMNQAFTLQADLINKLTVAWWISTMADLELGHCVKFALCAGTGDLVTEWNPYLGMGGDLQISARDARDTLPIRPATHNRSIQAWDGLILRESHTVNVLKGLYPGMEHRFRPTTDSLLSTLMGRFRHTISRLISPGADTLSGLEAAPMASRVRSGEVLLYRTYLTDRTKNLTTKPIPMGTPGASWAYVVPPGGYLYPYKRLIVSTPDTILYDGPNTYWHGQFPVSRLKLWDLPWHFYGLPLLGDLIPMQDAINASIQDIMLGIRKWLDPSVTYDRSAVSESFMRGFDPQRPGTKIKLNTTGAREGFKINEGPPANVMQTALGTLQFLLDKFNDLSGTPNLNQLLALRQLPSADTLAKYWEAMTPELRAEGRQVEAFLRDVAEQSKVIRFQYESNAKRVAILGDAGLGLADFDFDPEAMVPSLNPGDVGYTPDLDASKPRHQRAQAFHKSIVFTLAPNSILAMNATEQKMIRLQLARGGMYDFWSLCESLEIPNIGAPPAIPLPPLTPIDPVMIAQMAMQPGGAQAIAAKYTMDPMTGQLLEIRVPQTVTERLIAQQQMGIGMSQSPAGRKASGQAAPEMETKSDGRTTVTESE